jgi:hypothetical protein
MASYISGSIQLPDMQSKTVELNRSSNRPPIMDRLQINIYFKNDEPQFIERATAESFAQTLLCCSRMLNEQAERDIPRATEIEAMAVSILSMANAMNPYCSSRADSEKVSKTFFANYVKAYTKRKADVSN